jgi:hypothetical protein
VDPPTLGITPSLCLRGQDGGPRSFPAPFFASRSPNFLPRAKSWLPEPLSFFPGRRPGFPSRYLSSRNGILASRASIFLPETASWLPEPPSFFPKRHPGFPSLYLSSPSAILASRAFIFLPERPSWAQKRSGSFQDTREPSKTPSRLVCIDISTRSTYAHHRRPQRLPGEAFSGRRGPGDSTDRRTPPSSLLTLH